MPLLVNAPQTHVLTETQEEVKKEGEQITSACAALSGRCFWRLSVTVGGFSHTWEPRGSCSCPVCLDYSLRCRTTDLFASRGQKHGDSGYRTEEIHQEGAIDGRGRCPKPHRERGEFPEFGRNRRACGRRRTATSLQTRLSSPSCVPIVPFLPR